MNNKNSNHPTHPLWWCIFIAEYLRNGENGTAAYRKAKPNVSDGTAEVESCKLLKNPNFSKVLAEEREKLSATIDLSQKEWIAEIVSMAMSTPEKIEASSKLKALELLGKAKGYLRNQIDVTSDGKSLAENVTEAVKKLRGLDFPFPELTDEEIERLKDCRIEGE